MKKSLPYLFIAAALFWMTPAQAFEAYDDGWQSVYGPQNVTNWMGLNGGNNYTAWTRIGGDAASQDVTTDFKDASAAGATNDGDFTLKVSDGEAIVGRNFEDANGTVVLGTGTFSVRVWFNPDQMNQFTGFALLDASANELVRWGIGVGKNDQGMDRDGFVYKTADGEYKLLLDGIWLTDVISSVEWESLNDALAFTLTVKDGDYLYKWDEIMPLSGADSVGGIAVVAGGGTSGNNAKISFDEVRVTGRIVPEPGTLALLATGLAGILARWRRRG